EGDLLVDVWPLELVSERASNQARDHEAEQEKEDALDEFGPIVVPVLVYPVPHGAHCKDARASALGRGFAFAGALSGRLGLDVGRQLSGSRRGRYLLDLFAVRRDLHDQIVRLIEELASGRNLQVFDPDLVVDLLQAGHVDGNGRRQVGRQTFHLQRVQPTLQVGLTLGDEFDLALDFDRDFRLDLLGQIDLIEIDVEEITVAGAPLYLADQRLTDRLVSKQEIDQLVAADLLVSLDELAPVHQHRDGVH